MGSERVEPREQCVDCADCIEWLVPTEDSLTASSNCLDLVDKHADERVVLLFKPRCDVVKDLAHEFPAFAKELAAQRMCIDLDQLALWIILSQPDGQFLRKCTAVSC